MSRLKITLFIFLCSAASFYGGIYIGLCQGVLYSLGLEAHSARYRISEYERGELFDGEFKRNAEFMIDSNITYFGKNLKYHWFIHQVPSPWSLSQSGTSFMKIAIGYRLENPRKNNLKRKAILSQEITDQFLRQKLEQVQEDYPDSYISEKERLENLREFFEHAKLQEAYYQHALNHIKQLDKNNQ